MRRPTRENNAAPRAAPTATRPPAIAKPVGEVSELVAGCVDLSNADVVFAFLSPRLMRELKRKVLEEMRPGSIVASYDHRFEGWQPDCIDRELKVYLYRLPLREIPGQEGETTCTSKVE